MDKREFQSACLIYQNRLNYLRSRIEKAKTINESRDRLLVQRARVAELSENVTVYLNALKLIQSRAIKENDDFRTRRLELLNTAITEALAKIFPKECYKAVVSVDYNRKDSVRVRITDKEGFEFSPHMANGKLLQYLVTFSGVCCITEALGSNCLYIDEAFGASSLDNLSLVGEQLQEYVDKGFQIILVSQNPGVYCDVERREIHLQRNSEQGFSFVKRIDDFSRKEK